MKALISKNTTRTPAEELEVGMSVSINYSTLTIESITPVGDYALRLTLRQHFGGSSSTQVYLSDKVDVVKATVYAVYGPDPVVVDDREVYCKGCESAEYQEILAEVLYEGGTRAEAQAHLRKHVRLITCDSCLAEYDSYQ